MAHLAVRLAEQYEFQNVKVRVETDNLESITGVAYVQRGANLWEELATQADLRNVQYAEVELDGEVFAGKG